LPAAWVVIGDVVITVPRTVGAGLASGMGDLDARYRPVLLDGPHGRDERLGQIIVPDPGAVRGDAAFRGHGGSFDDDQAGTAPGHAGVVGEMPVIYPAIDGRVLAHGRYGNPVAEGDVLEGEGLEQRRHG